MEYFYYLLAWLVLGFNAGVIYILTLYIKNESVYRKERNKMFWRCIFLGAFSFLVFLVYFIIILFTRRK